MPIKLLDPDLAARLTGQPFTYPEVGATAGNLPADYPSFSRTSTLITAHDFETLSELLFGWQVQQRSRLRVAASSQQVETGAVVVLRWRVALLAVSAPCRVVHTINEPRRRGFAYGTLPGHPESGEESFLLELRDDGQVDFTIAAFSRPAITLTKLAGPIGRAVQHSMTTRYLRSIEA